MSVRVMGLVWEHGPEAPADRLMLLAIADNADDHGLAWPGVDRLAAKCCITRRSAQRALRRLEAEGWITTIVGGGTRGGRTIGIPSRYQLNIPALSEGDADDALEISTVDQLGSQRRRFGARYRDAHVAGTINEPSISQSPKPE